MKAKIAERGQVTIPKALRNKLGLTAGTILEFSQERDHLIVVRHLPGDPVSKVFGCLGRKIDTDATMTKLRGHERDHRG